MKIIPDKFDLSREDAVFVAKKYLKDSVYRSAQLEGMAVTFPQTEVILENGKVNDVSAKDISKVIALKNAWEYILDDLDQPTSLKTLEELHEIIAHEDVPWNKLGKFRSENVRISGTNYMPEVPDPEKILSDMQRILDSESTDTDKAITLGLYIMRAQPFLDGNKRVGTLIANKELVARGRGIFSLPPEMKSIFGEKLVKFYETGEMSEIKDFIYENCLTGM